MRLNTALAVMVWFVLPAVHAFASDWPMYRANAQRDGYTPMELPNQLFLQWSWHPTHPPRPAWPRDDRMSFDRANHVVVANGTVCFGSSSDDKVCALDSKTGRLKWTFFASGPVRFAPAIWREHLFVSSDDGNLYCLNLADGSLVKQWHGSPKNDAVLGNERIISKWPARGGPVIFDNTVYWAAGIWQSEGVSIHALDAVSHDVIWTNDTSGGIYMPQPHGGANAKSGVSAQGYLMTTADRLFVPTGRAVPAAFDRTDGHFLYYHLQANTRRGGTSALLANSLFYNGGHAYRISDGSMLTAPVAGAVSYGPGGVIHGVGDKLRFLKHVQKQTQDRKGNPVSVPTHEVDWQLDEVPAGTCLIVAGNKAVTSSGKQVATVDLESQKQVWTATVDHQPLGLAAADSRLFVSASDGSIHCYGESAPGAATVHRAPIQQSPYGENTEYAAAAKEILRRSGITEGWCIDLECGNGGLAFELAKQSQLQIVAIDPDPDNVAEARRRLDAAGLYGSRVSVRVGSSTNSLLPKYIANLVVSARSLHASVSAAARDEIYRLQRPYGGLACIGPLNEMEVTPRGDLENAGEWTHLYSNPSNTLCSADTIKGPLSVLWFGDIPLELPQRHGRGPSPLFYRGRLFAEGLDELIAVDAYNGRLLWRFEQKGILDAYNADHLAGTAITGSNICVADGSVFLRNGNSCFQIDTVSGEAIKTFSAPNHSDGTEASWGYVACEDGVLFGSTANEGHIVKHAYRPANEQMKRQFSESTSLFAFEVKSGKLLWQRHAEQSIRHNAIAIGNGSLFLIDRALAVNDLLSGAPARRGKDDPKAPKEGHPSGELVALNMREGTVRWKTQEDVFGTTLAFSPDHETLLMFYQSTRFKLPSEVGGRMAAFHGGDGYRIWDKKVNYSTRPLINDRTIIAHPSAVDLVSGNTQALEVPKSYGCGQLSGSRNLLMFRSGTLGYFDFTRNAGTENFGGMRPGCWINALPVGGLVLVPDASAGCQCSYQNRSWVALQGAE